MQCQPGSKIQKAISQENKMITGGSYRDAFHKISLNGWKVEVGDVVAWINVHDLVIDCLRDERVNY
jgi:hypothetical protein